MRRREKMDAKREMMDAKDAQRREAVAKKQEAEAQKKLENELRRCDLFLYDFLLQSNSCSIVYVAFYTHHFLNQWFRIWVPYLVKFCW